MCTAIVVMGLVIAPIAIAVSQAITLVPEAKTRTDRAMETTFLVDRFANDVADSNILPGVVGNGADTITCGELYPAAWFFPENTWYVSATDWELDGLDDIILYTAHWTDAGSGVTKVELKRTHLWLTEPERTTWYEAQLVGYCRTGDVVLVPSVETGLAMTTVNLKLSVRPTPDGPLRTIDLKGAVRRTL